MTKQVVVVRKDLNMSAGKIAAQTAHAVLKTPNIGEYEFHQGNVCITCSVKSEQKLFNLVEKAKELNIPYGLQMDSGRTEVEPNTYTVLSLGPVKEDMVEKLNILTKRLQLYVG